MHKDQMLAVTRDVIESGRTTSKNVFAARRDGMRRILDACDKTWHRGVTALSSDSTLISPRVKNDLISIEGQLTLIAGQLLNHAADRGERAINDVANVATSTVNECGRVFDLRVVQAMSRVSMPIAETIRTLAGRIAAVSQELAELVALDQQAPVARKAHAKKSSPRTARAVRRGKRTNAA